MAKTKIKCWKKGLGKSEKSYYRKDNKYSFAESFKTGLPLKEMKRRGHKGTYIFSARIGRDGKNEREYFKTKKEADKRLLTYLKSHDKC